MARLSRSVLPAPPSPPPSLSPPAHLLFILLLLLSPPLPSLPFPHGSLSLPDRIQVLQSLSSGSRVLVVSPRDVSTSLAIARASPRVLTILHHAAQAAEETNARLSPARATVLHAQLGQHVGSARVMVEERPRTVLEYLSKHRQVHEEVVAVFPFSSLMQRNAELGGTEAEGWEEEEILVVVDSEISPNASNVWISMQNCKQVVANEPALKRGNLDTEMFASRLPGV
eukprot:757947-Hanusia_phi.AAC.8